MTRMGGITVRTRRDRAAAATSSRRRRRTRSSGRRSAEPSPTRGLDSAGRHPSPSANTGPGAARWPPASSTGSTREHPDLASTIRYQPIEAEARRIDDLAARLEAAGHGPNLDPTVPTDEPPPIDGIVLANEVLDALPTHRLVMRGGQLVEVMVGIGDGARFVDVEAEPSTPALAARLASDGVALADGQRAEVCLALEPWIAALARGIRRGLIVLIDYGYPATGLYDPIRRRDGTLRAYLRHRVHDDPYIHVGRQDLTAHVDVSAVERAAAAAGLTHLGTTSQAEYLVGLGIEGLLQAIQADPATTLEAYLDVRSALLRLLDPSAMGRFRVMGFGQRWPLGVDPAGFDFRITR